MFTVDIERDTLENINATIEMTEGGTSISAAPIIEGWIEAPHPKS